MPLWLASCIGELIICCHHANLNTSCPHRPLPHTQVCAPVPFSASPMKPSDLRSPDFGQPSPSSSPSSPFPSSPFPSSPFPSSPFPSSPSPSFSPSPSTPASSPSSPSPFPTPGQLAAAEAARASASQLLGRCTLPVPGMVLPSSWPSDWPTPAAHFPLTTPPDVSTWPGGQGSGTLVNATWVRDARWGSVIRCDKTVRSTVQINTVPYGKNGPVAVNMWVRTTRAALTDARSGDADPSIFQYIFSHTAEGPYSNFGPNQVGWGAGGGAGGGADSTV